MTPTLSRPPLAGLLLFLMLMGPAHADAPVSVDLHRMVPVSDKVSLAATIWKPADAEEPLTTVLVLTPYVSDEANARAMKFARAGYAYMSVDVRGRGSSEGEYEPMRGHGPDGAGVAEWIRSQAWSDGRVVMRGGSYRGMTQWQVMAADPDALAAAIPTASAYPGHDFPNPGGILLTYAARWLAFTSGNTRNGPEPELVEPGQVNSYVFDGFYLTARRIPAGSRLRLVLFPLDSHQYLRNYNTGGKLGRENIDEARAATVSVQVGGERGSYLELPLAED